MKFRLLLAFMALAITAQAQPKDHLIWDAQGNYSCEIGYVCPVPSAKEIGEHNFFWNGTFDSSGTIELSNGGPCNGSFSYNKKTNTCTMTIQFDLPGAKSLTCTHLENNEIPDFPNEMKCVYTPGGMKGED